MADAPQEAPTPIWGLKVKMKGVGIVTPPKSEDTPTESEN